MTGQIISYCSLEPDNSRKLQWPVYKFTIPKGYDWNSKVSDICNPDAKVALFIVYRNRYYFIIDSQIYIRLTCLEAGSNSRCTGFKKYKGNNIIYWLRYATLPQFAIEQATQLAMGQ